MGKCGAKPGSKHLGSLAAKLENVKKGESIVIIDDDHEKVMNHFAVHKLSGNLIGRFECTRCISIVKSEILLNGVIFTRIN